MWYAAIHIWDLVNYERRYVDITVIIINVPGSNMSADILITNITKHSLNLIIVQQNIVRFSFTVNHIFSVQFIVDFYLGRSGLIFKYRDYKTSVLIGQIQIDKEANIKI
jgi:hypothetical protein